MIESTINRIIGNYIYYKYNVVSNEDGYVKGLTLLSSDATEFDFYGQIKEVEANNNGVSLFRGCYKCINGEMIFDSAKYEEILRDEEAHNREALKNSMRLEAQCYYTAMETDTMLPEGNDINSPSYASKIKKYYELGLWSKAMVKQAVSKGLINANEYELITGEPYVETTEQSL